MGIFRVGTVEVGVGWEFSGWKFFGWELSRVGIFPGGNFPGGNCLVEIIQLGVFLVPSFENCIYLQLTYFLYHNLIFIFRKES